MRKYYTYILSSRERGVLYVGVTNDLVRRVWEDKNKQIPGFTQKYLIDRLVYMEEHASIQEAIQREKQLKKWNRDWKIRLIEEVNPGWDDLYTW